MFQGSSALLLDAKGRMTVPTRHRDALAVQCEGRLTLTRSPDGCLLLLSFGMVTRSDAPVSRRAVRLRLTLLEGYWVFGEISLLLPAV